MPAFPVSNIRDFCGLMKIMRLGVVTLPLLLVSVCLHAQDCPAIASVLPNATLSGTLDATNCRLTDGSAYMPYRLDLPVRGQIKIDLGGGQSNLAFILRDGSGVKIDAGASLVQVYSGLIYRGPQLVNECVSACLARSRTVSSASR